MSLSQYAHQQRQRIRSFSGSHSVHILDIATILFAGLLTGNELTVSLFISPVMWQLDEQAQAKAISQEASF